MSRAARPLGALALAGAALLAAGCTWLAPVLLRPPRVRPCPGPLVPVELLDGDFVRRAQVRVRAPDVDVGFEVVVQKRGPELILIGLTGFGPKAFVVRQRGRTVEVVSALPGWPVPPENVLRDVHRTLLLPARGPTGDARATYPWEGREVEERYADGVLRERRFGRAGAGPEAIVTYAERSDGGTARVARLQASDCGYEATLVSPDGAQPMPRR